jgi:hypothetical protein
MAIQTDVLSGHLTQSGYFTAVERVRLKAFSIKGASGAASQIDIFSTNAAPVTAAYGQSGTTITVTKTAHGLAVGDTIGIAYAAGTGGTATCGNAKIATVPTDDTFTITCINSATITGSPACYYVTDGGQWLISSDLASGDTYNNYFLLPGEGILCKQKLYGRLNGVTSSMVFYG